MEHVLDLKLDKPAVAIFGSARLTEDHPVYEEAAYLAERLARKGIHVLTGGGPGLMEAANRGAHRANGEGKSYGIRIQIPHESTDDSLMYHHETVDFEKFYARQSTLIYNAQGHVAMVGGVGTAFEVLEVLTLMQTGFMPKNPILLYDWDYWQPLYDMVVNMIEEGTVSPEDIKLLQLTNDVDEIADRLLIRLNGGLQ